MSLTRPDCTDCAVACECEHVAWFSPSDPGLFGVAWKCPKCEGLKMVVSTLGPREVGPTSCLHCGADAAPGASPCPTCGVSLREVLSEEELEMPDEALLATARDEFAEGTCRRGLTILNHVLRRNDGCDEARAMKAQFIEHLDDQEPFAIPEVR